MDLILSMSDGRCRAREPFAAEDVLSGTATDVLQAAIDRLAPSGGSLTLLSGEFPLERTLRLRSRVSLRGSGRSTRLTLHSADANGVAVLGDQADGAEVANLTVVSSEAGRELAGIVLRNCGDCRITGTFAKDFGGAGVEISDNSFLCRVEHAVSAGCGAGFRALNLARHGRGGDFVPNLIIGCQAHGGGIGFAVERALVVNLVGCIAYQTAGHGFHLWRRSNSVLLSGCRTFQVGGNAVRVDDSHEVAITGNIFCWTREENLILHRVSWGTVSGNNFIDAGVRAPDGVSRTGVVLEKQCRGITVTGNNIFNWSDQPPMLWGLTEDGTGANNVVAANHINFCTQGDLRVGAGTSSIGNAAQVSPAYEGPPDACPDFTPERLRAFLARQ